MAVNDARAVLRHRKISDHRQALAAGGADGGGNLGQRARQRGVAASVPGARGDDHLCTFRGETLRDADANAAARTGHDRHLPFEYPVHRLLLLHPRASAHHAAQIRASSAASSGA